jgi:hypothetical protein
MRGFFLYAVEILESTNQENIQVLKTNLHVLFWKRVKNVMRQNNKGLLLRFLFETSEISITNESKSNSLEQTIQDLQIEMLNLKKKLEKFENTVNDEVEVSETSINDVSKDCGVYEYDSLKSVIKAQLNKDLLFMND